MTLQVLDFDRDTEKVSVGAKQLIPDPWLDADERYPFNLKVRGRIVGMSKFGAFVMLDDGIEGLAHVSEMSWTEKIQSPKEAVTVGDIVDCWVVRCEVDRRRLALSLKDPDNNPWLAIRDSLPIGTERDFVISKVVDFGLFVELDGGLDGLIHVSDFSWAIYEGEPSEEYTAGDTIRAIMLDIDEERGRANLGIKQLCADLTTELMQKFTVGQTIEVKVTSIQDDGLYAALKDGLDGFLPAKGLPEVHRGSIDENYENGQVLTAVITVNDLDSKRVELELAEVATPDQEPASVAVDETVPAEMPEALDVVSVVEQSEASTEPESADGDAADIQAHTSAATETDSNEASHSTESAALAEPAEIAEPADEDTNA
jgi:small subunit ribosomal protein S1